jgi:membrane associated rhomboid family serine protease
MANHHTFSLKPDDRLFVAMLTAWIVLLAVVTYLLLGWESAGVLIVVAGLFGFATIAAQSRRHRGQDRAGVTVVSPAE